MVAFGGYLGALGFPPGSHDLRSWEDVREAAHAATTRLMERIAGLGSWATSACLDARDRAVLAYVDSVASKVEVSDALFQEARAHLSEAEVVELTLVAGYWGMVARLLLALQIDVEPPFVQHLP